jgi:branched-chain amino acid transport system ATP-binding protein
VREDIWRRLHELKQTGLSMLIIDKELDELCALADRHYVIEKGEIVWSGDTAALQADAKVQTMYLAV